MEPKLEVWVLYKVR